MLSGMESTSCRLETVGTLRDCVILRPGFRLKSVTKSDEEAVTEAFPLLLLARNFLALEK